MVELQKIDAQNLWKVVKLSVRDDQADFIATNTESILEAFVTITAGKVALPFAVCADGVPVGFVMFGYGSTGDKDEPSVAESNYCLWRFMIDQSYQGRGYGRQALAAALDYVRTRPCGPAEYCWLSYEPENQAAKALYTAMGFCENGEMDGDEIVSILEL